ncbi:MAG TPA: hypothetical protein VGR51_04690 [Thermoplasmata archaeon]|nr:hypothetical protein [Thermoplasmata archaeon]
MPRLSALLRQKAIADPLSAMWTELNWLVTDDPWMDHTLTDVDRVMAILNQPEEPTNFIAPALMSALDAIDIDAIINQLRIRRAIGLEKGSAPVDALGMYLRTLGTRSPAGAQNPLVAVLTRAR